MLRYAGKCALLMIAVTIGCGTSQDVPKYLVQGTVTYQSKPVSNAIVQFQPDSGAMVIAPTDKDGGYSISAPAGSYRVGVVAMPEIPDDVDPWQSGAKLPPPLLPGKYERPETSGIVVEILAEQQSLDIVMP